MNRRNFLASIGLTTSTALLGKKAHANELNSTTELMGILVDTTKCIGCQSCEFACAEANGLPEPELEELSSEKKRVTSENQWTVVNKYETEKGEIYAKKQCMHCNQPACATACLTKAMYKTEKGPVIWRENKCMGCRFCMISCPFDIPKFEYNSPVPKIQKCKMCFEALQKGSQPACVENCAGEALLFGTRRELLETARARISQEPEKYNHHIYGENEVGGTGFLYLASVPFEQLGFRQDLGTKPYPEYTQEFLYAVPIVITLWPAFLVALNNATKRDSEKSEEEYE